MRGEKIVPSDVDFNDILIKINAGLIRNIAELRVAISLGEPCPNRKNGKCTVDW